MPAEPTRRAAALDLGELPARIVKREGSVQDLIAGLLARAVESHSAGGGGDVRRADAALSA